MIIGQAAPQDRAEWLRMRTALWPECSPDMHTEEMEDYARGGDLAVFIAARPTVGLGGFLEVSLRASADGCESHPVGYIEGWYVDPDLRRQGIGSLLVAAAEEWAREKGCQEMASDCLLDNDVSLHAHQSLGYEEVERLIHFRKSLRPDRD
ncbi:MAG TPA: aminoglycoside 6'-N-acetyltransferase [Armatimonadota bacterium]|nr:aminoglycoside 6'-N-acetyltransferase [Armatimonadota bacterium]